MIRPARRADAGGIAAIWNHVIRETTQTFTTAEKDPHALAVQIIDQPCFVAEVAGNADWATFAWTSALSLSYLAVMLTMPWLGARADARAGKRRPEPAPPQEEGQ